MWYKPSFVAFLKYLCFRAALEKLGKPGHQAQEDDHHPVDDGQHLDDDGGRGLGGREHGGQEKGQSQVFDTEGTIKLVRQAPQKCNFSFQPNDTKTLVHGSLAYLVC